MEFVANAEWNLTTLCGRRILTIITVVMEDRCADKIQWSGAVGAISGSRL